VDGKCRLQAPCQQRLRWPDQQNVRLFVSH
jgi:hypothetical protein